MGARRTQPFSVALEVQVAGCTRLQSFKQEDHMWQGAGRKSSPHEAAGRYRVHGDPEVRWGWGKWRGGRVWKGQAEGMGKDSR